MVDKKILQWIQKAVDGALSPLESRRLDHHLNRDEEAKRYYQEMMKLSRSLENIHPLEPPEGLRERVIDNINHGSIQVKFLKPKHSKLREFFALRNLRPALAFAAGAAVMLGIILVMQSVTENGILLPGFKGAIGVHRPVEEKMIESTPFRSIPFGGTLTVYEQPGTLRVVADLRTRQSCEMVVIPDKGIRFQKLETGQDGELLFKQENGRLSLVSSLSGQFTFVFLCSPGTGRKIQVSIQSGDARFDHEIRRSGNEEEKTGET